MALLFFSGGIDSTVLAYDMAMHPYRYGIVDGAETLSLFTFGSKNKRTKLVRLVDDINKHSTIEIEWNVVECPLEDDEPFKVLPGGMKTTVPMVGSYDWDRRSMPYTPGLMLWLASHAVNLLANDERPHGGPIAFWGFQYEPPEWAEYDAGKEPPNDTSLGFIDALNKTMAACGERVRFRAPFMEARLDRYQIVRFGEELRVPWQMTSSCITGWKKDCGRCNQCIKRNTAFNAAGVT